LSQTSIPAKELLLNPQKAMTIYLGAQNLKNLTQVSKAYLVTIYRGALQVRKTELEN
jgi:hypothetical protein